MVKRLISEGDLLNANLTCQELVKVDPYNKKLLKLFRKIENKILDQNEKIVKKEIDRTWNLWDEKRYDELLRIYQRLYEYAPQYEELHQLIDKAEKALGTEELKKRKEFIQQAFLAIKDMFDQSRYGEVVRACEEFLIVDPRNEKARDIQKRAKEKLVDAKLKENERIVDSGEYERQLELYGELLKIDPRSSRVKKLQMDALQKLSEKKKIDMRMTVNEGMKRIKNLFVAQEYEKVLQACEDVMTWDKDNLIAKIYRKKAESAIEDETDSRALKIIQEGFGKLREEYEKNKAAFVRI